MLGSQAVIEMLKQAGVEVVFGLCGDTSLPLYEAFHDARGEIRHVLTRDERSASYMADCYARLSGRLGVCEGPSGGGATYIIPGAAEADNSSVPLLAVTTDIDLRQRGKSVLTELDQDALFAAVTSYTATPAQAEELPAAFRQALRTAVSGAMGASHIGLGFNVQTTEVDDGQVYADRSLGRYPAQRPGPEPAAIKRLAQLLVDSPNPVIVAGAGVIRSEAWDELKAVVDLLGCPVATSISGKGAVAETDPLALGVVGSNGGLEYRHEIVKAADLVFFVGCQGGSVTTDKWKLPTPGTSVVQMDVDPARLGLNYSLTAGVACDAKAGLAALAEEIGALTGGAGLGKFDPAIIEQGRLADLDSRPEFNSDDAPMWPERFLTEFFRTLPQDAVVVADPGTPTPYLAAYLRLPKAGRHFVAPRAHGALGYSLPGVVGAHFARPRSQVIGIMGDGSFGISAGELETIARLNLPVVLIVLANACYGWIKAGQRVGGEKYFSVDFSRTDHAAVARAYGLTGIKVEQPAGLAPALEKAYAAAGPVLLDAAVQPLHLTKAPVSKWVV